jgi:hypothetical protein
VRVGSRRHARARTHCPMPGRWSAGLDGFPSSPVDRLGSGQLRTPTASRERAAASLAGGLPLGSARDDAPIREDLHAAAVAVRVRRVLGNDVLPRSPGAAIRWGGGCSEVSPSGGCPSGEAGAICNPIRRSLEVKSRPVVDSAVGAGWALGRLVAARSSRSAWSASCPSTVHEHAGHTASGVAPRGGEGSRPLLGRGSGLTLAGGPCAHAGRLECGRSRARAPGSVRVESAARRGSQDDGARHGSSTALAVNGLSGQGARLTPVLLAPRRSRLGSATARRGARALRLVVPVRPVVSWLVQAGVPPEMNRSP